MKSVIFSILAGVAIAAGANAQNLIVNPGFEDGAFIPNSDNTMVLANGSTTMTGWTVFGGSLAWISTPNPFNIPAPIGLKFLDLTGYNSAAGVRQTVSTTAGVGYVMDFDLGSYAQYGNSSSRVTVSSGANTIGTWTFAAPGAPQANWVRRRLGFISPDSSITVAIEVTPGFSTQYVGVDDVQVYEGCLSDFNRDEVVDFFDYLDFVAAFAEGGLTADFNSDDEVDFFDYLDFVGSLSSGC